MKSFYFFFFHLLSFSFLIFTGKGGTGVGGGGARNQITPWGVYAYFCQMGVIAEEKGFYFLFKICPVKDTFTCEEELRLLVNAKIMCFLVFPSPSSQVD